jgi:proteasome lid subunit RPN8/RPN11
MRCRISRALLARFRAEAQAAAPHEVCGLLIGGEGAIVDAVALPNAAADPARAFLLDPAAHLAAARRLRLAGRRIIGCYHSHPAGTAIPSAADAAGASQTGQYWLIVGGEEVRLWYSVADGEVAGRFAPVALVLEETTALQPASASANRDAGVAEPEDTEA